MNISVLHRRTGSCRYAATSGINPICLSAHDLPEQRSSTGAPVSSKVQLRQSSSTCRCFSAERSLAPEQETLPDPPPPRLLLHPPQPTAESRRPQEEPRGKEAAAAALLWGQSPDVQAHVGQLRGTLDSTRLPAGSLLTDEAWLKG